MKYHMAEMDKQLDFWNLMAYDYAGRWSQASGHNANLYKSDDIPAAAPFNTEQAIEYYTSQGVDPSKIVLGMPLYGRSFMNTDGPGEPFDGVGQKDGVWDYKVLPLGGAEVHELQELGAAYSYDPNKKMMISYDTPSATKKKASYIKSKNLGGGMWWETSGDKDKDSLIKTVCTHSFVSMVPLDS
jgi:chitinase